MSEYRVVLTKAATADYGSLDGSQRRPVRKQLDKLARFPDAGDLLKNVAGLGELSGHRKLYVAKKTLRIVYSVDEQTRTVLVKGIGPRADLEIYKRS